MLIITHYYRDDQILIDCNIFHLMIINKQCSRDPFKRYIASY